jgi:hypothetical protein
LSELVRIRLDLFLSSHSIEQLNSLTTYPKQKHNGSTTSIGCRSSTNVAAPRFPDPASLETNNARWHWDPVLSATKRPDIP